MRLRGATVLARALATGELVTKSGKVEIRYDRLSPRAYHALAANLAPVPGASLEPDDHCVEAESTPPGTSTGTSTATSTGTGGSRTRAASGKVAQPPPVEAGTVVVYADGACSGNPGPAGLGVVVIDRGVRTERSEYLGQGTNNIAELTAIARALETVTDITRPMAIHTDSLYAIGLLSKGWKAKANQALVASLRAMLVGRKGVRFVHVRGHSGIPLNERADELARRAITERKTRVETFTPTATSDRHPGTTAGSRA